MRIWLLGLVVGLVTLALPVLPVLSFAVHGGIAAAGCLLLLSRRLLAISGLLLGFAWGAYSNTAVLDARLPQCVTGSDRQLVVEILDDPQPIANPSASTASVRFRALVLDAAPVQILKGPQSVCRIVKGTQLRLAWYRSPPLQRGQRWTVSARVKPPWGYQNPGGFDFERWLLSERLQGTGYVLEGSLLELAKPSAQGSFRARLRDALSAGHLAAGGVLYALVSGDGSRLSAEQWQRFRATGTIHLMVVSGLHVGLVAGLGYLLGGWLVRAVPPLLLWLPARRAGALGGMVVAGCFVVFTGSGVPGVRALCMSCMAFLAVMCGRRIRISDTLLVALATVLLFDPVVVHQKGFWLSFCAVTVLVAFFAGRHQRGVAWHGLWSTQLALCIGLTPMLAALHGQIPVVGVLANMLAVPVMSVVVIPLVLISAALLVPTPELAGFGFYLADGAMRWLLQLLGILAGFPTLNIVALPWLAAVALASAMLLLLGASWRNQVLLWLLWLCWWLPRDVGLIEGEFRVTALDVGQGSSILVDTSNHRLLFDAGPSYPSGFDLGAAVVVPSIAATGARRLDVMVLSHSDLDHHGGAQSVLDAVPVARVFKSVPDPGSERCRAGVSWIWDGVTFRFLSPSVGLPARSDNDGSCVLEINNARERALLPGDISAVVERKLLREANAVRLLFAPHHGSNTSSSNAFVRILNPDVVFVSAGKDNRYNHPHEAVVRRYRTIDADLHITGEDGALIWESRRPLAVQRYRIDRGAYWTSGR